MRRYRVLIKGSAPELTWLNKLAADGWLLTQINGNWYKFERTTAHYRILSEYVPNEVAETLTTHEHVFKVLTKVPLTVAKAQVVYTGSLHPQLQQSRVDHQDAPLELKIAVATRLRYLNEMDIALFMGLVIIIGSIIVTKDGIPDAVGDSMISIWVLCVAFFAMQSAKVHTIVARLRRETQNYNGAWRPTNHVFLEHLPADLDLEKVASLGEWRLVGHDKKGSYWYDVQSLASEIEIRDAVMAIAPKGTTVKVVSFLGLAPIGYL
ncbi:hypothetical protein RA086_00665 [Lactiplantibacillus sp. WILCCON 0030]|uniref:DUF2812 domain-containing protein n=1 Tax=Lactiplantibacillus brownii TaxID=3069269 RepID=A0ABU1A592_9LACO|nr:hypothetical protein [Lactiplantibacillus brownii]MDQ7936161.1 hypothetical protein [Lactiplantibacillus brownii]